MLMVTNWKRTFPYQNFPLFLLSSLQCTSTTIPIMWSEILYTVAIALYTSSKKWKFINVVGGWTALWAYERMLSKIGLNAFSSSFYEKTVREQAKFSSTVHRSATEKTHEMNTFNQLLILSRTRSWSYKLFRLHFNSFKWKENEESRIYKDVQTCNFLLCIKLEHFLCR